MDYLPFGEQIAGGAATTHKFTGQERDFESSLDHFDYRNYSSSLGRWASPDPQGNAVADPTFPQSWNLYNYVLNNPLNFTDPTGLDCAYLNDAGTSAESIDHESDLGQCENSGGYWANGWIAQNNWVQTNPFTDNVTITSQLSDGTLGTSIASQNWTQGAFSQPLYGNDNWWGTFGRTFIDGVLHGVRKPGQSFASCVDQNIKGTTFGKVDPQKLAATIPATAVGLIGASLGKVPFNIPFDPGSGGGISAFTASAYGIIRALGITGAGTGAAVGAANGVGYFLAVTGSATAGLTIGSAINCR